MTMISSQETATHIQRGNNTGIDPRKVRKEITSIYKSSKSTKDFIAALDKAGYALTRGRRNQLVLVDRLGDTHGLLRNIEGRKLADLRQKFHGIDKIPLPPHAILVKMRKPIKGQSNIAPRIAIDPKKVSYDVQRAYKTSKTGAEFFARINKKEYSIGIVNIDFLICPHPQRCVNLF